MDVKLLSQGGQLTYNTDVAAIKVKGAAASDSVNGIGNVSKNSANSVKVKSTDDVKNVVDKMNKLLKSTNTHTEYEIYGKDNDVIINVIDNNTKKVIQEIPPKKIVDMIDNLSDISGIVVDKTI